MPAADARGARRLLSASFEALEAGAERLGLEGFTLGVTSLESVFLGFAGQQAEETAPPPGMLRSLFRSRRKQPAAAAAETAAAAAAAATVAGRA